MNYKNVQIRKWIIIVAIELLILLGFVFLCVKEYEKNYYEMTFSQEQLVELSDYGIDTGYYIDTSMSSEGQVEIGLRGLTLNEGMYDVEITYESAEGAWFFMQYEHGRNEYVISGNVKLEEMANYKKALVDIREGNEPLDLIFRLPRENASTNYLLIREITISSDFTGCVRKIFCVVVLLCLIDFEGLLYWNRKKISMSKEKRLVMAALLGVVIVSGLPLYTNYIMDAHDLTFHLARIEGIKNCLLNGDFPARIQPQWLNGHGYPVSVFYGDLFLYVPAVLRLVGISLQNAYKIYVILINVATVCSSYFCFGRISENKKAGILGSAIYALNIYRLSNIYVRGAVGEYTAMVFFPLILYGLWHILKKETGEINKNVWVCLAIGYLGVLNSHLISCVMVGLFTVIVLLIFIKRVFVKERFIVLLKAFCGLLAGGVWILIPLLQYMSMGFASGSNDNFVFGRQEERGMFWAQFFATSYDVKGTSVSVMQGMNGEMPLTLGVTFLILVLTVMVLCIYDVGLIKHKKEFFTAVFMCVLAMWLCTNTFPFAELAACSDVLMMIIKSIQYPWRFLAIVGLMESWIAVLIFSHIDVKTEKVSYAILFSIVVSVFVINDASNVLGQVMNEGDVMHVYDEANLNSMWVSGGEYLYQGVDIKDYRDEISNEEEGIAVAAWRREKGKIYLEVENAATTEKTMEVPLIFYQGYRAHDVNTKEELALEPGQSHRIKVKVEPGYRGEVCIWFQEPVAWRVAEMISLCTCAYFGICIVGYKRKSKQQ